MTAAVVISRKCYALIAIMIIEINRVNFFAMKLGSELKRSQDALAESREEVSGDGVWIDWIEKRLELTPFNLDLPGCVW